MRPVKEANMPCPCPSSSCLYRSESEQPSIKQFIANASNKIDQLYLCKYLPLRERKLVRKLHKTRAVYNRIWDQNTAKDDCICDIHHKVPCEGMDPIYNLRQLRLCRSIGQKPKGVYKGVPKGGWSRYHGQSLSMSTIKRKRQKPQQFRSVPCSCDFECYESVEELVCGRTYKGNLKHKSEKQKMKITPRTRVLQSKSTEKQNTATKKIKKDKETQFKIRKDSLEKFREKQVKEKGSRSTKSSPELLHLYSPSKNKAIQSRRDSKSSKKTLTSHKIIHKDNAAHKKQGKTVSALTLKRCFCTLELSKKMKDNRLNKMSTASQQNSHESERCFCSLKLKPKNKYVVSEPFYTKMRQETGNIKVQTSLQNLKVKKYPSHSTVTKSVSFISHQKTQTRKDEKNLKFPRRVPARSRLLPLKNNDKTQTEDVNFSTGTRVHPSRIWSQKDIPSYQTSVSFSENRSHECLKIQSSFCLDIKLCKDRETCHNNPTCLDIERCKNLKKCQNTPAYQLKNHESANGKLAKTKLKRCFCTLELNLNNKDNVSMNGLPDGNTVKPGKVYTVSRAMVPGTIMHYSQDISLNNKSLHLPKESTKKLIFKKSISLNSLSECKLISNYQLFRGTNVYKNHNTTKKAFYNNPQEAGYFKRDQIFCTMFSTTHKLEPYECEPGVCVPGKCDPYVCYKRIMQRGGIQYQYLPSKEKRKKVPRKSVGVSRTKQKSHTRHAQFDEMVTEKGSNTPPRLNKNQEKVEVDTSRSTLTSKRLRGPTNRGSDTSDASTQLKVKPAPHVDRSTTKPAPRVEPPIDKPVPRIDRTYDQAPRLRSPGPSKSLINIQSNFNLSVNFSKDGLVEAGDGIPCSMMPPCSTSGRPCNRYICPRINDLRLRPAGVSTNLPSRFGYRHTQTNREQYDYLRSRYVQHTPDDRITIKTYKQRSNLPPSENIGREARQRPEIRDRAISADFNADDTTMTRRGYKPTKVIEPSEIRHGATMTKRGFKPTKIIEPYERKRSGSYSEPGRYTRQGYGRPARDTRYSSSIYSQRRDMIPHRRMAFDHGYGSSGTEGSGRSVLQLSSSFSLSIEFGKPHPRHEERHIKKDEQRPRRDQQRSIRGRYEERPSISKGVSRQDQSTRNLKLQTKDIGSKKVGTNSLLQRCFCTHKLKKNLLQRCFCTLKLQKGNEHKVNENECKLQCCNAQTMTKPYRPDNVKTMTVCNPNYGNKDAKDGSDIKPCKDTCPGTKNKNKNLLPYECEPGICVPGQCEPNKCLERIQKRNVMGTYYAHTYNIKLLRNLTPKRKFSQIFKDSSRNHSDRKTVSKSESLDDPTEAIEVPHTLHTSKRKKIFKDRDKRIKNYDDLARNNMTVSSKHLAMNMLKSFPSSAYADQLPYKRRLRHKTFEYMEPKASKSTQNSTFNRSGTIKIFKPQEASAKITYKKLTSGNSSTFLKKNVQKQYSNLYKFPRHINNRVYIYNLYSQRRTAFDHRSTDKRTVLGVSSCFSFNIKSGKPGTNHIEKRYEERPFRRDEQRPIRRDQQHSIRGRYREHPTRLEGVSHQEQGTRNLSKSNKDIQDQGTRNLKLQTKDVGSKKVGRYRGRFRERPTRLEEVSRQEQGTRNLSKSNKGIQDQSTRNLKLQTKDVGSKKVGPYRGRYREHSTRFEGVSHHEQGTRKLSKSNKDIQDKSTRNLKLQTKDDGSKKVGRYRGRYKERSTRLEGVSRQEQSTRKLSKSKDIHDQNTRNLKLQTKDVGSNKVGRYRGRYKERSTRLEGVSRQEQGTRKLFKSKKDIHDQNTRNLKLQTKDVGSNKVGRYRGRYREHYTRLEGVSHQEQGTRKLSKSNKDIHDQITRNLKLQTKDVGSKKVGPNSLLQRCFGTLKLQKANGHKENENKHKYQSSNAQTMTKPYKAECNTMNVETMTVYNPNYEKMAAKTMTGADIKPCRDIYLGCRNKTLKHEPGICAPGQCDLYKCLERLQNRNIMDTYFAHTYNVKLLRNFTPKRLFSKLMKGCFRNHSDRITMSKYSNCIDRSLEDPIVAVQVPLSLQRSESEKTIKN